MQNVTAATAPAAAQSGRAMVILECLEAYRRHKGDPDRPRLAPRLIDPKNYVPPVAAQVVHDLTTDPTRAALRGMVREIGWSTFTKGGTAAMRRLADQVDRMASDSWSLGVLDKWFDQIGDGADKWTA